MGTYVAKKPWFTTVSELAFTMPEVNLTIPETNENYWKIWLVGAECELVEIVGAEAFMTWKADRPEKTSKALYVAVTRQIEWEKLHRQQKAELLDDNTCTCFGTEFETPCPVCQAMADGMEIPY